MNSEMVQAVLDIIFSKFMLYLAPMVFMLMAVLFSDRVIEIVYKAITEKRRW
ncbi:hypothetical protein ACQYAD_08535 [Neobacillus sp. SM06]|uniref:hypothetical protein n=1 Tax=Neobacillus sp. SM06 TaxID=3422492 RepID=UPI003D2BDD58